MAGGEREVLPAAGLQQDDAQRPVEGSTGGIGDVIHVYSVHVLNCLQTCPLLGLVCIREAVKNYLADFVR